MRDTLDLQLLQVFSRTLPSCDSAFTAALPLCSAKNCPIRVFSKQSLLFTRTH
jgi:hypothetical protein